MAKQFFGTDGVRGLVGQDPMSADFALRLASAAAQVLVPAGGTVLIGKDPACDYEGVFLGRVVVLESSGTNACSQGG